MDLSLGGPAGSTPTTVALETTLSYLARVDATSAQRMRATLQPFLVRFPGGTPESFSKAEHDTLTAAIDDVISLLERERLAFITATSEGDYEWTHRNAIVARQTDRMFRLVPPDPPGGGIPPAAWQAVNARDAAMAENVGWVLNKEGPQGRVFVFAHNVHVKNARSEGGAWSVFERPPNAMGLYLRSALDNDMVIIGTSSGANASGLPAATADASSIDAALARVGLSRFVLDLRASHDERAPTAWLAERRALRANFTLYMTLAPGTAFDALLFIDTLTPAHTAPVR